MEDIKVFKNVRDNALSAGAASGLVFAVVGGPVFALVGSILGAGAGAFYANSNNKQLAKKSRRKANLKDKALV